MSISVKVVMEKTLDSRGQPYNRAKFWGHGSLDDGLVIFWGRGREVTGFKAADQRDIERNLKSRIRAGYQDRRDTTLDQDHMVDHSREG